MSKNYQKMSKKPKLYRFFEFIPASLVWLTFILALVLSFVKPLWAIYYIIIFDLLWLFRVSYFVFYIIFSYQRYKQANAKDWFSLLQKEKNWQDHYHLIFLPTYGEPVEVLETTFEGLLKSDYDKKKMIIVLAGEERAGQQFLDNAKIIQEKYTDKFYRLLVTVHPDGIVGEIKGKSANATYAAKQAQNLIDELQIPYEKVIVSNFDCDTAAHPQYFAHLTYKYINNPNPTRASYQPAVLYNNNMFPH
jgi:cellulose synthase/poly-beta-1,6-N-acetylglucosamine synthase-like glycosyltransferase